VTEGAQLAAPSEKVPAARLAAIVESSDDAIIGKTLDGVITTWNGGASAMYGYTPQEMIGHNIAELIPADRAGELTPILERLRRGERVEHYETRRVRKDGTVLDVSVSVSPVRDADGTVTGAASVARDISPRLRAAAETARLAAIVESSVDAIIGMTLDGVITTWNGGASAMYGYTPQEMIGHNIAELIPADRAGELEPILERAGRAAPMQHYETRRVRKDRTMLDVSVSVSPVRDADGTVTGAASVARDISARVQAEADSRAMEARLRQAERLETVGQLAAGVAHDFNNLLGVIIGFAGMLTEELGDQPALQADVKQIMSAAQRGARLTRQLLIFSGRDAAVPQLVDLNEVLAGVQELLLASLGSQVDLVTEPAPALPPVRIDRGHVEQVLLNLAVNARDAMPGGGGLRIATGVTVLGAAYCAAHSGARPGRYVELTVSDTGDGMTPEVAARAFEPFFTTKPLGEGTGLGLATVHGVVTNAGGSVSVDSHEGAGTVFRCYLPPAEVPDAAPGQEPGAAVRVLVVDDEPGLLSIAARMLRKGGYEVVEASDAAQALSLMSSPEFRVDLLLTDAMIPHMRGAALAERAAEIRPGIRVLYMSGYHAAQLNPEGVARGEVAFIEKPFTGPALLEKVRSVLGAPAPG